MVYQRAQKAATQKTKHKLFDIVSRSSAASDNMVLDVATGMGTFLAQLLEKCSADASIIGTDIDEKPLRGRAREYRHVIVHAHKSEH